MSGLATAKVIDVHAHAVLAETMGTAGEFGPVLGQHPDGMPYYQVGPNYRLDGVRYAGSPFMDVDVRLARMTARGIDAQILSPNPLTYLHFIPAVDAIRFCRIHNDALSALVKPHSDRLAAFAALPMQEPSAAVEELHRAVGSLGMLGGYIGTDSPRRLDDPAFDALYEACVSLDVPLFIHPGPAGIDGPAGDPALKRFDLDVVLGFAAQETLAVATLIYGGVLDRHPKLDICFSHGGGATGYLFGRMAQAARKRPWSPEYLRKDGAFEERVKRLWFDNHLNRTKSLDLFTDLVGTDHLVFGTNFAGWDEPEDAGHGEMPAYLADNARRLLRIARRATP